jgi:hypothetical protein
MTMAETIRRQLHNVEPMRSAYDFAPLEQHYSDALAENLLHTVLRSRSPASAFTARLATTLTCASVRWASVSLSAPYAAKSLNDFSGKD